MNLIKNALLGCTLASCCTLANATVVSAGGNGSTGTMTDLGLFSAGTYLITGSGVVDLVSYEGNFSMNPDGTPQSTVTAPGYSYFNPAGSFSADGQFGAAGTNAKIGALIGTLSSTPSWNDWFLIGYSKQIILSEASHIYASVNDTWHNNNVGAFEATVSPVPEPETYAMLAGGLALLAATKRKKD